MAILKDLLVIGKSKFNTPIDKDSLNMSSIIDTIYPVGSIYMSINSSSPAILFGGTWVQIEDQFLLGCSSSYSAGSTGGSATVTLTESNMPAHAHDIDLVTESNGSHTHTTSGSAASAGSHTHTISGTAASAGSHTHSISGETSSKGSSTAHNNMPPYLAVYIWKRTA